MITTGQQAIFSHGEYDSYDEFLYKHLRKYALKIIKRDIASAGVSGEVIAEINGGRWIVNCPFCQGAELVWDDKQLFMCESCWNKDNGYQFMKVILPNSKHRQAIEAILERRPDPRTRNWCKGETVKMLEEENKKHGVK